MITPEPRNNNPKKEGNMKRLLLVSIVFLLLTFAIQAISISKAFATDVVLLICLEGKEQVKDRHVSDSTSTQGISEGDSCGVVLAALQTASFSITDRQAGLKFKKGKPEANQIWYELTR